MKDFDDLIVNNSLILFNQNVIYTENYFDRDLVKIVKLHKKLIDIIDNVLINTFEYPFVKLRKPSQKFRDKLYTKMLYYYFVDLLGNRRLNNKMYKDLFYTILDLLKDINYNSIVRFLKKNNYFINDIITFDLFYKLFKYYRPNWIYLNYLFKRYRSEYYIYKLKRLGY